MAMAENEKGDTASSKEGEEAWGTLEELLLVCAVSRHGTTSWDSIAMEVQKRTTTTTSGNGDNYFSDAFTPRNCEQRYDALNRRFNVTKDAGNAVMVDELRKLRVEELRREVERRDVSIVSLQLTVKRLEEERERSSSKATEEDAYASASADAGTDLERRVDRTGSAEEPEEVAGEPEDRSFNESNSTRKRESDEDRNSEPDPVQAEPEKAPSRVGNNSGELSESKRSGDLQSSASLSRRRRRGWRRSDGVGVGSSGDEVEAEEWSPANKKGDGKSQPLIRFLEIVRSHKHGLVFQRRLPSQETEKYRSLIRQHMDLETVRSKLDRGVYCDTHPRFYRDILLVFTNAILFFCKSSTEHAAARELRKLVIKEIVAQRVARKPMPAPLVKPDLESQILDAVVKKPRSSTNIVVCRRRTNSSAMKPSSLSSEKNTSINKEEEVKIESLNTKPSVNQKKGDDVKDEQKKAKVEKSNLAGKSVVKTMTSNNNASSGGKKSKGAGAQQGESNNSNNASASNNSKKSNKDESSDEEDQPINKRRKQLVSSRKQGVVNFLKRIKQNSPSKEAVAKLNNTDEPQEEKASKAEIGKKKVAAVKKKDDDDGAAKRRVSGRKTTKGEEVEKQETTRRGGGRPPARKAAMGGGGTPDSGQLKRRRDGEKEAGGSGKNPPAKKRTRR